MVKSFLKYGHLLKEIDRTHITSIPKKENPKRVSDYRPISLCNVSYNFIYKVLANRVQTMLPKATSAL